MLGELGKTRLFGTSVVTRAVVVVAIVLASTVIIVSQPQPDGDLLAQLHAVSPDATSFSAKEGNPPHYKAYVDGQLAGYAFWTTELEPLERGYDGPIKMLVGLNLGGLITGILVVEHHEPYGNFSVEDPAFVAQFKNKSVRDPFRVGQDVDAVSRATITITSATRAIKNSSRRIARRFLHP